MKMQRSNNDRANTLNPNNPAYHVAARNHAVQCMAGKGGGGGKGGGTQGGKGGGGHGGNWPSGTGNPSGGGRGNAPPAK